MNGVSASTRTHTRPDAVAPAVPKLGLLAQSWHFARHFLEMCLAMCVGGGILNALLFVVGPALIGYPDLRQRFPGVALLAISIVYTLPMATWMRFRRMDWRPILEMSGATIGLAVVLIALAGIGVVPVSSLRGWALSFCGPACILMIVVMLFRIDLYTGRAATTPGPQQAPHPRPEQPISTPGREDPTIGYDWSRHPSPRRRQIRRRSSTT
jgi:hypothetical protein